MKTYYSILYFNTGINERINVGLIMFNKINCMVDVNNDKMNFVKKFKPDVFNLFKLVVNGFKENYSNNLTNYDELEKFSRYANGIFKIDIPQPIAIKLSQENFDKLFDIFIP